MIIIISNIVLIKCINLSSIFVYILIIVLRQKKNIYIYNLYVYNSSRIFTSRTIDLKKPNRTSLKHYFKITPFQVIESKNKTRG